MLDLISTVSDGLQIVKTLADDQRSATPRLDRLDDDIVVALREIYFTPNGVITLLEQLANGLKPDRIEVEHALPKFNDAEWRIGSALQRLEFASLAENKEVSLKRARVLDQLRYGKINLRRDIQSLLNQPLTFGKELSKDTAVELLKRVTALNAQIESLEEAHNYRARR